MMIRSKGELWQIGSFKAEIILYLKLNDKQDISVQIIQYILE